jgi:predicted N-acetyltransferase YhbS
VRLSFRFATEADIPAILKLRLAVDGDQAMRFGDDRWATSTTEKSVARNLKSSRVIVASQRSRIVGAARMETKKPWAIDLKYFTPVGKAVYLGDVNVDPELQRTGIGLELMDQVKEKARGMAGRRDPS